MSIVQALRACAVSLRLAAVVSLAVGFAIPGLAIEARIGVDTLEFSWSEATGNPPYYAVWLSRGTGFSAYDLVEENRVSIDVAPGDRITIYVHGARPLPDGKWEIGPASKPSPVVYILAMPTFDDAEAGHWISHCGSCGTSIQRELGDPSLASSQYAAPEHWSLVTQARFADGSRWLVWQRTGGWLLLSNFDDPQAAPIGPIAAPVSGFADTLDIAGDGEDEFLFVDPQSGNRLDRYALAAGSTLALTGSAPGMAGGELGPIADYDGDGQDDLLWVNRDRDLVAVWSFTDFHPQQQVWRFRDSYLLDVSPTRGYHVVAAADYDGNGEIDLLWRGDARGDLWVNYMANGAVDRIARVPALAGDAKLEVIGSPEIDRTPGAEIALRSIDTGRIWIAYPAVADYPAREAVMDTGPGYETLYVGP